MRGTRSAIWMQRDSGRARPLDETQPRPGTRRGQPAAQRGQRVPGHDQQAGTEARRLAWIDGAATFTMDASRTSAPANLLMAKCYRGFWLLRPRLFLRVHGVDRLDDVGHDGGCWRRHDNHKIVLKADSPDELAEMINRRS